MRRVSGLAACLGALACSGPDATTPAEQSAGTAGTFAQGGSGAAGVGGSAAQAGSATADSGGSAQGGTESAGAGGATGGSTAGGAGGSTTNPPPATPVEALCQYLEGLPAPATNPAELVNWWEAFATDYSNRSYGTQSNLNAGEYLRDELSAAGYATQIREFESLAGPVRVIEGLKTGSELPDQHVGLSAHYDIVTTTTMGAYDNASGVAVQLEVCRLLSQVQTRKSIACLFFDAEEIGTVGSLVYVREVIEPAELFLDQVFGFDMVGLDKLYAFLGLDTVTLRPLVPRHSDLLNATLFDCLGDTLGVTETSFELVPFNDRRSDEASFMVEGIPVVRFAGGRTAGAYDGYHNQLDTVDHVFELAGSRTDFENSMAMAALVSYYSVLAFDRHDPFDVPEL